MGQTSFSIVQISDLHLAPQLTQRQRRFTDIRDRILKLDPSHVVVTGDLSDDGKDDPKLFDHCKRELQSLPMPCHVVPGNHDVGNLTGLPDAVSLDAVERFKAAFGDDRFVFEQGNWVFLGLDSQIIRSDTQAESDQYQWFDKQLDQARQRGKCVAVFLHTPPFLNDPDEAFEDGSSYWAFGLEACRAFLDRVRQPQVKLLASGHLHWYRQEPFENLTRIWCPCIDLVVDDARYPHGGDVTGFMHYRFEGDRFEAELIQFPREVDPVYLFRHTVERPGHDPIQLGQLTLDFTGTLSKDGKLLPGVAQRLQALAPHIRIHVLTADTFGTAREALKDLPVHVELIKTGRDKADYIRTMIPQATVHIGNGRNDAAAMEAAGIGIAVIGPEGAAREMIDQADVVVHDINDALDLLANPLRLTAALRD